MEERFVNLEKIREAFLFFKKSPFFVFERFSVIASIAVSGEITAAKYVFHLEDKYLMNFYRTKNPGCYYLNWFTLPDRLKVSFEDVVSDEKLSQEAKDYILNNIIYFEGKSY